ncbi:hypothetical protein I7X12_05865 [Halosimplex litoreum]|uniref:Uncharacterized protein n=1 Tax=Halosimplex litoreum TaxID=1198301 RepID=A0A7T3KWH8_9EURY|nr:hypothetical protein [Halosimplex litoreum]QPV64149.1 hypothetical protein I7X12_05865 [Halosimplex litoreum]
MTDRTDDFDFVRPDGGTNFVDRLDFTALDGTTRTDTWLSNEEELDWEVFNAGELGVWDPDTDDDGLTDGQEVHGLTKVNGWSVVKTDESVSYGTDPADADTDGDGYWDGWIGVYGVEWSDNVVLYQEHLSTGDGIEGEEVVPEQIGTHHVSSPVPGADVDSDGKREHSNIHLGETYWDGKAGHSADPIDAGSEPDLDLAVEVDRYENASAHPIGFEQLFENVSNNYALYGFNITFTSSDTFSRSYLRTKLLQYGKVGLPIDYKESVALEQMYHDEPSKLYMFVTTEGGNNSEFIVQSFDEGIASTNGNSAGFGWGVLIFTADHDQSQNPNHKRAHHLQKTIVHEVGHIIGAGRKDDGVGLNPFGEVYSGSENPPVDRTLEAVGRPVFDDPRWSVMSSGWVDEAAAHPMNGSYMAYSIEELLSVELRNIATVENDGS